ncbi:hypothetical protein MKX01_042305 [Papaver californicum]|nr:hypothetical protein MKX01_042305 [Papaver californicum]
METSKFQRVSGILVPVIFLFLISYSINVSAADDISIDVAQPTTLKLSSGLLLEYSPGIKPGTVMVGERVNISGVSRLKNLKKYAHTVKVKVIAVDSSRPNAIDVCFHRNTSLRVGMCNRSHWEKLVKGVWIRSMSPYDSKLLDIRMPGRSLANVEVSVEEEFFLYRIILLVLGLILLTLAPTLSKSLIFYYGGAMTLGIILVVLMVLFQGMRLLPTGRKNSLAIFVYSSLVGMGSFLLRYLPGLLKSLLVEIGVSEDMYNPLAMVLSICLMLAGAWLGFWAVHKLVLTEEGSIDSSVAVFVAWSIRIVSAVLIIQSSMDHLLAAQALFSGILISSILRRIATLRSLRHILKHLFKTAKSHKRSQIQDYSLSEYSQDDYLYRPQKSEDPTLQRRRTSLNLSPSSPAAVNQTRLSKTPQSSQLSDSGTYLSTFHRVSGRKKFSKEEYESFTKDSTKKALESLVASPDFNKWAVANAERITLTPTKDQAGSSERRPRWLGLL